MHLGTRTRSFSSLWLCSLSQKEPGFRGETWMQCPAQQRPQCHHDDLGTRTCCRQCSRAATGAETRERAWEVASVVTVWARRNIQLNLKKGCDAWKKTEHQIVLVFVPQAVALPM